MHNLIDREALKRDVRDVVFHVADTPLSNDPASKLIFKMGELLAKKIDDAPGVDAEPVRHGRWEPVFRRNVFGEHYVEWHACSICKELALSRCENYMDDEELSNYCPNCGAKMTDGDV